MPNRNEPIEGDMPGMCLMFLSFLCVVCAFVGSVSIKILAHDSSGRLSVGEPFPHTCPLNSYFKPSPPYALITGSDKITEAHQRELDRILQISFNPLSATMITDMDKVRINLLCVYVFILLVRTLGRWQQCTHVLPFDLAMPIPKFPFLPLRTLNFFFSSPSHPALTFSVLSPSGLPVGSAVQHLEPAGDAAAVRDECALEQLRAGAGAV